MLPGKKYTPEDLLSILFRRIWYLLVPFAVVSAGTAVYVRQLPDLYQSEVTIQVQPPRVAAGLVATATPTRLEDTLPAIQQQVLSRTRLERIVVDLDLYPQERRLGIMEDVVERVRAAIQVSIVKGDAFKVSYVSGEARTAQLVAQRVADNLIDESNRDRSTLTQGTDQFLEAELETARKRLIDEEEKVRDYRRKYDGELPGQIASNLQAAQNNQTQLRDLQNAIDHDQERQIALQREIAELENAPDDALAPGAADGSPTAQQYHAAQALLAQLQLQGKTADHPDVIKTKKALLDLEGKLEEEARNAPVSADGGRTGSPAQQARQRRLADDRAQVAQLDKQLVRNTAEVQRLRQVADQFLQRAQAGPTRETEMTDLNRDYATIQGLFQSLSEKKEEAALARSLEERQIGTQMKIIDSAHLPSRPYSPDRRRYNMMGMVAGAGAGLVLLALLEYRNISLQTDDEVTAVLSLPVLAVVPVMESDKDRRRRTRWRLLTGSCLGGIVLGCLGILVYTFVSMR